MKIRLTKTTKEETKIDIGKRGSFILIKTHEGLIFGRLERVVNRRNLLKERVVGYGGEGRLRDRNYIEFSNEESYFLKSDKVMGLDIPRLAIRSNSYTSLAPRFLPALGLEQIFSGLSKILNYLENHPEYRGHADLIRRIAEAQKQR